jgi:hypothetical protein
VPSAPASPDPGPDEDPRLDEAEPPGPDEEYDDPEHPAMPWDLDVAAIWAETGALAAEDAADAGDLARRGLLGQLAATDAGIRGRRGPGQPGSARRVPGWSGSPAGGFGAGQPLDVAPGGSALLGFAERVAGDQKGLGAAGDDEIIGLICALDRAEASACSLKHAAAAELIRQRKNCIVIGVTSASLASFGRRPNGRRTAAARLPRHRPQPGRPSLHCAITGLPGRQRQGLRRERAVSPGCYSWASTQVSTGSHRGIYQPRHVLVGGL